MKLMCPLVSRTAHSTRSSDPIPSCLAAARSSPSVIRLRARFLSIGSPVLDDDDRLAVERRSQEGNLEAAVGNDHGGHRAKLRRSRDLEPRSRALGGTDIDSLAEYVDEPEDEDPGHQRDEQLTDDRACRPVRQVAMALQCETLRNGHAATVRRSRDGSHPHCHATAE
jgi:hypothetical protein